MGSFSGQDFERLSLSEYAERAYLDYSMYVVLDRALPHVADGLKPVQRRIVYAMSELSLSAQAKPKKAARTVGDVIGKFHPHGDLACYEAMVLMAQPFSYRYPLVDGHGNFGSVDDPKSFAAMRYTEARLSPFARTLLAEIDKGTVDFQPNFDGTLQEPVLLPARLPNVLLNGASGIAVGMATDIPPHNLRELASALELLLKKPNASLRELRKRVLGPDFPTTAEIISPAADLDAIYEKGTGSVRARATWNPEGQTIVIDALPHQVAPGKVIEQIAQQMRDKKLPMVEDLRDEGDHENPVRLVLMLRSRRIDTEALMQHLFATTDLERSYRVNLNVVALDGKPKVLGLKALLSEWLAFRIATVRRRSEHRLAQVEERMHVLDGYLIAFLNIDEVIRIIRESDEPKPALMAAFDLSEAQAEAVLALRLRQIAKLEEIKIRGERDALAEERKRLFEILGSEQELKQVVATELREDTEEFGDARRSPLVERESAQAFKAEDVLPSEPVTVVMSARGWVRAGKGHDLDAESLSFRSGDSFADAARCRSNQQVVFLDDRGRSYSLSAHTLPSARSQGEPLTGRFEPPQGASFLHVLGGDEQSAWLLASDAGYGFVARLEHLHARAKAGKQVLSLPDGAVPVAPTRVADPKKGWLAAATSAGYLLVFPVSELPEMPRGKGNKIINIPKAKLESGEERLVAVTVIAPESELRVYAGKRHLGLSGADLDRYRGARAQRGGKLPRGFTRVEKLSGE